jgi:acyl-CoA synthetase (AMP-forming)/AMP-acid ligase II
LIEDLRLGDGKSREATVVHARPVYRPGLRRHIGHLFDVALLLLRPRLLIPTTPLRFLRQVGALRYWGTTLAGLSISAVRRDPHRVFLIDETGALTFAEVDDRTGRLAVGLPLDGPRPRVGVLCRNHRGMVETLIACSKRGAEVVLLNTGFGAGQLRAVLGELRVHILVADAEFAGLISALRPALRRVVVWADEAGGPGTTLEEIIQTTPAPDLEPPLVQGRTIMLSSGTMGRPKGARRPPRPGLGPLASVLSRIPMRIHDTMIIDAPLFHTWGYSALQIGMALRSTLVLHRRFEPEQTLRAIGRHRRVCVFAVPVMVQRLLDLPRPVLERYDTSPLRVVALSGAALPGDLATRFMAAFGPRLYNVYGTTEASWVSIAGPAELARHPGTAGRPPRGTSLVILDERDRPVPRAVIGRIYAANEMPFEGYTGGEPSDGWEGLLGTGDLGHLDRSGLLFVDGRHDGLVVSGGENIVPRDVEDALARLPEVREAAVIGIPDDSYGQRLAAYVVLRPGMRLEPAVIQAYVHDQVARYAVPRDVHFIAELPRNATGKVVYRWLPGMESGSVAAQEGRVGFWPLEGAAS